MKTGSAGTVAVVISHSSHSWSMRRFSELLVSAYRSADVHVEILRPPDFWSRRLRGRRSLLKLAAYVELLIIFPLKLALSRFDTVHFADHSDALILPLIRASRSIVTCHDLIAVKASRGLLESIRVRPSGRIFQSLVSFGLRRASLIECVSDCTRVDVERLFPDVPAVTVHNCLDPQFAVAATEGRPANALPYLLVVSSSGWRKRRGHALRVWRALRNEGRFRTAELVVVGPALTPDELHDVPQSERDSIHYLSGLGTSELKAVYRGAAALIQTSKYEGFGWPIIEANAQGVPALCSDIPVFREVAGDAGIFIDEDLQRVDWPAVARRLSDPHSKKHAWTNSQRFLYPDFSSRIAAQVSTMG